MTTVGTRLLNDSIAGYVYSILGAQAKIRASIVYQGAIILQCQDVFRQLVKGGIPSNDVIVGMSNMRKAVNDCNQVLNLAVSPDVFLLPSDMTILKERTPGYSNVLYTASEKSMRFGVNSKVNYNEPKKRTQVIIDHKKRPVGRSSVARQADGTSVDGHTTDLVTILLASTAVTFIMVKYVI